MTEENFKKMLAKGQQTESRLKHRLIMFWMWWQEKFHSKNWDE